MDEKQLRRRALQLDVLLRNAKNCDDDFPQLIKFLDSFQLIELVSLLGEHHDLFQELMDEAYEPYWCNVLADMPVSTERTDFRFKKSANISAVEYLVGYIQTLLFIKKSSIDDYDAFFALAFTYNSYYALNKGIERLVLSLYEKTIPVNQDSINMYLAIAETVVSYHGTPGYLALANLYFHLGLINKAKSAALSRDDIEMRPEILGQMDAYVGNAFRQLVMAELLFDASQNEIHNAYFGQGLACSNPFQLDSIAAMKRLLNSVFPDSLLPNIQQQIIRAAQTELGGKKMSAKYKLLADDALDVVSVYSQQEPLLLQAARLGWLIKIKTLIANDRHLLKTTVDKQGNTALHLAILAGQTEVIKYLLTEAPELRDIKNNYGDVASDLGELPLSGDVRPMTSIVSFFRPSPLNTSDSVTGFHVAALPSPCRDH